MMIETGRWWGVCIRNILLHCTWMVKEIMGMNRLKKEAVDVWQEMENKGKVLMVLDKACGSGGD